MENLKKAGEYFETTDYGMFDRIHGNRKINIAHVNRLVESMSNEYLLRIIIVNERFQMIDGHHSLEAIKTLGLPVYFVVKPGYTLEQVHIYNRFSKQWTHKDYLDGYCDLGYTDYLQYRDFQEKYGFGHTESYALLKNLRNKGANSVREFSAGKFKVKDYSLACQDADKLTRISAYFDGWRRREFVFGMLKALRNPAFDFEIFLKKLSHAPSELTLCVTVDKYVELIEKIYNRGTAVKNRVNLKYLA